MKKYRTFAYIFIAIFIVLAIAFVSYQVMSSNPTKQEEMKEKSKTEINYIESRMLTLFNYMNNIQFENYKISISEVTPGSSGKSSEKSTEDSSQSGEGGMGEETKSGSNDSKDSTTSGSESSSETSGSSSESENGESGGSSSSSSDKSSENTTTTYQLKPTGVLLSDKEIDWDKIKKEIESIYISIPTITLDLYQTDIEDQDILNFNTEFDTLTKVIEEQNKANTLMQLVKVYENVVKFTEKIADEQEKVVSKTKLNIYRAYSKLDDDKWDEISKDMQSAIEEFTKLLTRNRNKR